MSPKEIQATLTVLTQAMTAPPCSIAHPVDTRDCTCPDCTQKKAGR